jgi:hypothetical protein
MSGIRAAAQGANTERASARQRHDDQEGGGDQARMFEERHRVIVPAPRARQISQNPVPYYSCN